MPKIGTMSRRDLVGLRGRDQIVWSACPGCKVERWVPASSTKQRCRSCSGKLAIKREQFRRASHKDNCVCRRCLCSKGLLRREKNPAWKGGTRTHKAGYIYVLVEENDPMRSMAGRDGEVFEHRLVMARSIGRPLLKSETVHHRDGNKKHNEITNLDLWVHNHGNGIRVQDILEQYGNLFGYFRK